jgi:hypothetical protein
MRSFIAIVAFLAVCTASSAQPLIAPRGIVNGASFMAPGLPAGSIAQGSLFTIFGIRLGPTVDSWAGAVAGLLNARTRDRDAWEIRREQGRVHAARFSWAENARQTAIVYRNIMEGR